MKAPDLTGRLGEAWDVTDCPRMTDAQEATVAAWFVHVPTAHPWWPRYLIAAINLADIPGVPSAQRHYPEAEWELLIMALDPARSPSPDDVESWLPLTPMNVCVQFDGCDAERAKEVTELAVRAVLLGVLPIEPDNFAGARDQWHHSIRATASCGRH